MNDPMIAIKNAIQSDPDGLMLVCLGFEVAAAHCLFFQEIVSGPKNILRIDNKRDEKLMTFYRKPDRGVNGITVAELPKWNFKLLVYYVKLCELSSRPVVTAGMDDNTLIIIGDHRKHATIYDNTEKSLLVITHSQTTKNIDLVWEIVNEHLEDIRGTKGVPVIWCVCDTVSPKDHTIGPTLDYISIDEELVDIFPMIMVSYSGPRDETTDDDIYVSERTGVYRTDNNIFS